MLNIGTFLNLIYEHRNDLTQDSYTFVSYFFAELCPSKDFFERPYVSNLTTGTRDLTDDIKKELISSKEGRANCLNVIRNYLLPQLLPATSHDLLNKFVNLINSSHSIADKKKESLLKLYNDGKYDFFIRDTFVYAVSQDNVAPKKDIPVNDVEFVLETLKKCALCGKSIVLEKSKKVLYKYSIVNIFPKGLNLAKESLFNSIKRKPMDLDHRGNKICLCNTCADNYILLPDEDTYKRLVDKKSWLIKSSMASSAIDSLSLDDQIQEILVALKKIRPSKDLVDFRKEPLELKNKIADNEILKDKIQDDVNKYYYFVRKQLSELDQNGNEFKIIATEMQLAFQKLNQVILSQEAIYYQLCDWIMNKIQAPNEYRTACQIVVSFFVQNCEVFDEISK